MGTISDLQQNVRGIAAAAGLPAEDRDWLMAQIQPPESSGPYWNPYPLGVRPANPIEWLS